MSRIEKTHLELFDEFVSESRERLDDHINNLPENDFKGMRSGYYEIAIAVNETENTLSLNELRDGLLDMYGTDRRAIVDSQALHHRSRPVNHVIESVYPPNVDKVDHDHYTEYFRFRTDGFLFYAGQYNYDHSIEKPSLFYGWPIICIGRALIFASAACKLWMEEPEFLFGCRFTSLSGRQLTDGRNGKFRYHGYHECVSPEVTLRTVTIAAADVDNKLVDTAHGMLIPLYEHFDYQQLGRDSVALLLGQ